jgi:hypothetical protein
VARYDLDHAEAELVQVGAHGARQARGIGADREPELAVRVGRSRMALTGVSGWPAASDSTSSVFQQMTRSAGVSPSSRQSYQLPE